MNTQKLTIELPSATCRFLRKMIDSGEYANESEIIIEALINLSFEPTPEPGEPEYERWIKEEVLPAYDEMMAHPNDVYTAEEVRAYLEQERNSSNEDEPLMRKAG